MRILLIRFKYLGDVVLTLPVAEAIKKTYPNWKVDILTSHQYTDIFLSNPNIRKILNFEDGLFKWLSLIQILRREQYDVVVDFHSSFSSWKCTLTGWLTGAPVRLRREHKGVSIFFTHVFPPREYNKHHVEDYLALLEPLGVTLQCPGLMTFHSEELHRAAEIFASLDLKSYKTIALLPGARFSHKQWPTDRFASVATKLKDRGYSPLIIGHTFDTQAVESVQRLAPTVKKFTSSSLRELAAIFSLCSLTISNDTGLKHLAAAAGGRVIALHGHSDPNVWGPWGAGHVIVTADVSCRPCNNFRYCPLGTLDCLREIYPEEIIAWVEKLS